MLSRELGIYARVFKRVLDVILSLVFLFFFWWVYAIVAILVRMKLGTPIIFCQERPGLINPETGKEKIFRLYKFRSMSNEKDSAGNLLPDSERLTKFGRFLRATSIDELPEIINIIKGDMSIVGPRPWAVSYLKYFTEKEHTRHCVRPGLTGWAQVNGRTASSWSERLDYDFDYIEKLSFLFDVKILLLTIKKVLVRSDVIETAEEQGNFDDYRKKQWAEGTIPMPSNFIEEKEILK